jgi:hypothetical protein
MTSSPVPFREGTDPRDLVGSRVANMFHEHHRFYGRLGTVVGIGTDNQPLIVWDGCRKPRSHHPALLYTVGGPK